MFDYAPMKYKDILKQVKIEHKKNTKAHMIMTRNKKIAVSTLQSHKRLPIIFG